MNPRSKLRERLHEATSDAILDAAEDVFASQGLHQAKVEDIATRAGVSVGTLYNYFPDREGILAALVDARRGDVHGRLDQLLKELDGQPFARQLETYLHYAFEHFDAHREFFSILFQAELDRGMICGKRGPRELMAFMYDRVKTLVSRGVASGELNPELGDVLPAIVLNMWKVALISRVYDDMKTPMVGRAGQIANFIMTGAGRQPSTQRLAQVGT